MLTKNKPAPLKSSLRFWFYVFSNNIYEKSDCPNRESNPRSLNQRISALTTELLRHVQDSHQKCSYLNIAVLFQPRTSLTSACRPRSWVRGWFFSSLYRKLQVPKFYILINMKLNPLLVSKVVLKTSVYKSCA